MIIKEERVNWLPQLPDTPDLGWLAFDNDGIWKITNIHSFDDFGCSLDTFTIEKDGVEKEIYSYDEGETFTFDVM
jgi:hypothetical protein